MTGISFEYTIRLLLGDSAAHIAGSIDLITRRRWLRKANRFLIKTIASVDSTEAHRKMLMQEMITIDNRVRSIEAPSWELVCDLYRLVGRLLGYTGIKQERRHNLAYWQTAAQHEMESVLLNKDAATNSVEANPLIVRKEVVLGLKDRGFSDFTISLVMNTSEYGVKKLLKG